jgi:hypothetical protein
MYYLIITFFLFKIFLFVNGKMPDHYGEDETPMEETQPVETKKPRTNGKKLTDTQKQQLTKHMEKMKKGGMSASELKSHRMKMMGRMRRGMSVNKAHKDIMKG